MRTALDIETHLVDALRAVLTPLSGPAELSEIASASDLGDSDVHARVTFSGCACGHLCLHLHHAVAQQLGQRMLAEQEALSAPELADAIGELTNLIAGGLKTRLNLPAARISVPDVTFGPGTPGDQALSVNVSTAAGGLVVEIALDSAANVMGDLR